MIKKHRLSRVDWQVSLLTACIVIIACSSIFGLNYYYTYRNMIANLQERAQNIHDFVELRLDKQSFQRIESTEDMQSFTYSRTKLMLENIRQTAGVRYLYTAKRTDDGRYIYLIDGLPYDSSDFRNAGDAIEEEIIPDIERAYRNEIVQPDTIKKTSWGPIFISYFPIHRSNEVIGVIGIEFDAKYQYNAFRWLSIITPIIIISFCLVSGLIAALLFRRLSNPAYRDLANTDFLTGLGNRNAFDITLHNLKARSHRQPIGFLVLDLDGLKRINDTLGHAAGDQYIRSASELVQHIIQPPDTLYRIGGDEFAAILRGKSLDQLQALQQAILEAVQAYNHTAAPRLSLSLGCALFDPHIDATLTQAFERADAQMYHMKKQHHAARNEPQ